jgi:predicted nucleotidyltransferase
MKIAAIIAEYNPLHNGHLFQICRTKELTGCDALVCIMSGNFVQRGEPALIDKWNRTEMALKNGIDLVLELPVIYSLSSAEFFAHGAVTMLHKLGVINSICFGSECGNISLLMDIAKILVKEPLEYKLLLKENLSNGTPFAKARSRALISYMKETQYIEDLETLLCSSNNILGIEYCKSLIKNNSTIMPYTIKRLGGAYTSKELDKVFSSATSIRETLRNKTNLETLKNHIPESSYSIIEELSHNHSLTFPHHIYPYLRYKLIQNPECIKKLPDAGEGLSNRIYNALIHTHCLDELVSKIKTKRYTQTRITRVLCQLFMGFDIYSTELMRKESPDYARILGFNNVGTEVLKMIKKKESINLYTKLPSSLSSMLQLDILSTRMYSLINTNITSDSDFKIGPVKFNMD